MISLGTVELVELLSREEIDCDDKTFSRIITLFLQERLLSEEELANGILVSLPSVKRWAQGTNLPRLHVRRSICEALAHMITQRLRRRN